MSEVYQKQFLELEKQNRSFIENELKALEEVVHPMLFEELERICKSHSGSNCVIEMPLVQEIGKEDFFDGILAINSEETIAKQRYIEAGHTESDYTRRMSRQWSPDKKAAHADFVIINNGSLEELRENVKKLNTFN